MSSEIETLHPLEIRVLVKIGEGEVFDLPRCMEALSENPEQAHQVVSWLHDRGYTEIEAERVAVQYDLTERGLENARNGLVEERILRLLYTRPKLPIPEVAAALKLEQAPVGSAVGRLVRAGAIAFDSDKRLLLATAAGAQASAAPQASGAQTGAQTSTAPQTNAPALPREVTAIKELLRRATQTALLRDQLSDDERATIEPLAKKRGAANALFRMSEKRHASYRWTDTGRAAQRAIAAQGGGDRTTAAISALTPEVLQSGEWKERSFRRFNINIPPSRVLLGRTSTYSQFLRDVKDKLVALGFSEFDGPLVETEFWNCDALFMPQFHSARDTHDVYYVNSPTHAKEIDPTYLKRVAAVHRDGGESGSSGWRYKFDTDFTRRLILRSQGTALSAKQLQNATIPGKYFGVVRCFRYDQIDSTHLSDFYQTEGIVLSEHVNLRTLLGLLRSFAMELGGAEEVRFAPGYFPFTEPSVEVFVRHPELGWFELGGAGIFRPEVTAPFGIDVPVLAWGLGVDRMALLKLGLNDLRQLFTHDIEQVRLQTE